VSDNLLHGVYLYLTYDPFKSKYLDYFITLPREIELMWNRRFTVPKVLYFLLKYWVMAHSVLWMSCARAFAARGSGQADLCVRQ
jgi:hypothetical protein